MPVDFNHCRRRCLRRCQGARGTWVPLRPRCALSTTSVACMQRPGSRLRCCSGRAGCTVDARPSCASSVSLCGAQWSATWWGPKSLSNRVLVLRGRYGNPWWSSLVGIHQGSGRDDSRALTPWVLLVCVVHTGPPMRNPVFMQHVTGPDWVVCPGAVSARSLVLMSKSILSRCWCSTARRGIMRSTSTSSSTTHGCTPPVCSTARMQHPQRYQRSCCCRSDSPMRCLNSECGGTCLGRWAL